MGKKRKQLIWIGVLAILFVLADGLVYLGLPQKSTLFFFEWHICYESVIDRAAEYYHTLDQEMLGTDEQHLVDLLARGDERFRGTKFSDEQHADDPFGRLFNAAFTLEDLAMTQVDIAGLPTDEHAISSILCTGSTSSIHGTTIC